MNILLIGPQGSGKGTQAEKLIEKYNLAYVEMGGLLRKTAKEDTELGHKVSDLINNGKLVDDETVIEIVNKYLSSIDRLNGVLYDGFPRIVSQAEYFEKYLESKNQKLDLVINLSLPRDEVFKRLSNRRTCEKCGRVFNILTNPSKVEGICDSCGGNLIIRKDETPEKINARLDAFENQTVPMIEFFRQKGIVEEVDGDRPIEVIFEDIVERLKKYGINKNA